MSKTRKPEPGKPAEKDAKKKEPRILFFKSHIVDKNGKPVIKPEDKKPPES